MNTEYGFVRKEMLQQQAPPRNTIGFAGWARENLFSSIGNTILTLVAAALVLRLLAGILPWVLFGIWDADSLTHCRELFDAKYGDGREYACWAVVSDRWDQIIFGYSFGNLEEGLFLRPIIGVLLIFLAITPILFPETPRTLYLATFATLFMYPWLIWGGPLGAYLAAAVLVIAAFYAYQALTKVLIPGIALGVSVVLFALVAIYGFGTLSSLLGAIVPLELKAIPSREISGFVLAITIGIVAIVGSLPLAIFLALGRQSDLLIVNKLSTGFIEAIRGVPLITLLFVATVLLNYFLPKGTELDPVISVMILVTLFTAAYIAEVIRGGLAALPKGQGEAADALGLNYWQAQRLIILPQALKISIPGIVSNFISVFKDTTLVSIVAMNDPLGISGAIRASSDWNGIVWELYAFIGLIFWLFCFSMSRYSMYLERKLRTDHR